MAPATPTAQRDCCEDARLAIEGRRAILGPCLAAMGFSEHGAPPPELPDPLKFNGVEIPLESWERSVLLGEFGGDAAVLLAHLAEGIAFRAIGASRMHGFERRPPKPRELDATRTAMIEETAVGMALQQEIQRDIDRLVGKGEMGDAKRLAGFRRKVDLARVQMEERIGVQAREQAQARSAVLLTPRETGKASRRPFVPKIEKSLTLEDLYTIEEKLDKKIAEQPAEPTAEELFEASLQKQESGTSVAKEWSDKERQAADPRRRFRVLLAILVICFVAYAVFFFSHREQVPPPRLEREHFEHIEAVLDVKPRPPSLFVRVNASMWAEMPIEEKTQLVEELGRIAGGKGYNGVQVKTSAGTNVGQWLRKSGARLMVVPKVAS